MNAVVPFLMRLVKNIGKKSSVKVPWMTVVTMLQCSKFQKMDPVFPSALSMDVPIINIVTTLPNFLVNAALPIGNVKFNAVAKIYAMKVL